ncbi:MAG TPA: NADH-quinone oxidoreductase subunit K [Phototrophicaceae bacterium]|nr:NADH-quinone oxidoreductase subunit K [Phototrophicaceae bacterium]
MNQAVALVGVIGLLAIGLYGLMTARNLLKVIIALQLTSKAALILLLLAGLASGHPNLGQSIALSAIVVDTVTAVIALALAVKVRQRCGTLDVRALSTLRR